DELLLEMVEEDVRGLIEGTCLQNAPILHFSAKADEDCNQTLRAELTRLAQGWLDDVAHDRAQRQARPFAMSVDRCFSRQGRGTVVTGTAMSGSVALEQQLQALPASQLYRVRGLHRHGQAVERFVAPGRVALNLAGVHIDQVPTGTVLCVENSLSVTERFDAEVTLLPHVRAAMASRFRAMVHVGTTQIDAAISRLDGQQWRAGEHAFVQVHLDQPMAVAAGQAIVIRGSQVDPRFGQTLAGGVVLHPQAPRHRLKDSIVLDGLEAVANGDERQQVAAMVALCRQSGADELELARWLCLSPNALTKALKSALAQGHIRRFGQPTRYLSPSAVDSLEDRALQAVKAAHLAHPDRAGLDHLQVCRQVGDWLEPTMVLAVIRGLVRRGELVEDNVLFARPDFVPRRQSARAEVVDALIDVVSAGGLAPAIGNALVSEVQARVAIDSAEFTLATKQAQAQGDLICIKVGFWVDRSHIMAMIRAVFERFIDAPSFSTGELKELLGLTRKHLIPLAEFLDQQKVCNRSAQGDRTFRPSALSAWRGHHDPEVFLSGF
ncbi:MAG: hypothetical protein CMH53_01970, partial [Myxococcales bacterium]|nr:hypothetical protein [Myxococcales bacterium]